MARRPLTLLGGGSELARLVRQLIVPSETCAVVGSSRALAEARIPDTIGVRIEAAWGSVDDGCGGGRRGGCGGGQVGLSAAIVQATERVPDTQRLIVVLDETDDVAAAAFTILADGAVRALVRLDGIVATVDAVHLSTRLSAGQPVDTPHGLDRLAVADRILVARSRHVTPSALGAVAHVLRSINQTGPIIAPAIARCALDDLLDLDAWSGSPAVGPRPDHPSPFLDPDAPSMVVCQAAQPLDSQALDRWLDGIAADHAGQLLRLLGAVSVTAGQRRTYVHGVGSCLLRSTVSDGCLDERNDSSFVALVGRHLPAGLLQRSFSSCLR